MAHRHGNTGRPYTTGRADREYYRNDNGKYARMSAPYTTGRADREYHRNDNGARRSAPYTTGRVDKHARDDAYTPDKPQFVPSEHSRARTREYYASMLADVFQLVDAKPSPENVGIFQGIFALVDGVFPDIVSDEHRDRHGFLTCMRGVQCMLARMTAGA
jgi:hypothetical protein